MVTAIVSWILGKRLSKVREFQILLLQMQCDYIRNVPIEEYEPLSRLLDNYIPTERELFWKFGTPLTPEAWLPEEILTKLTKYN